MTDEVPGTPVSVDAVFESFPVSVRGAVVVRGQDGEPHQIRLADASVVEAHALGRQVRPLTVEPVTVDIAPHGEVLIPFDISFSALGPGWYCVAAEVVVDGSMRVGGPAGGGKRFVVPWPPEDVRRVDLRPSLKVGPALIERIQSKPDRTEIRWRPPARARDAELRVSAGSRRLPAVQITDDPKAGSRTTVTHPIPKRTTHLTLGLSGGGRGKASVTLDLG